MGAVFLAPCALLCKQSGGGAQRGKKENYIHTSCVFEQFKKIESQVSQLQFKSPATTAAAVLCTVQLQPQPTHEMYIKKSRNKINSESEQLKKKPEDSI